MFGNLHRRSSSATSTGSEDGLAAAVAARGALHPAGRTVLAVVGVVAGVALFVTGWIPGPFAGGEAIAQLSPDDIYLPLTGQDARYDSLVLPPTSLPATATPTPTATDVPTATATPLPTATPFVCGDLPDRVRVTNIDLNGEEIRVPARGAAFWTTFPVITVPRGAGAWVGWSSIDEAIHLTPLDEDDQRDGADWVVQGSEIRGLVTHSDGGVALLVGRPPGMFLVRLDAQGETMWETQLFGQNGQRAGSKYIVEWPRESRLLWDGRQYAAYVGHTNNFGAQGEHQGDLLWFFDGEGAKLEVEDGWDWGCSHSLDLRLAHNGQRLGPVCLSDAYPSKGFHLNHNEKELRKEPTGDGSGRSGARLGGWVPLRRDGFLLSFASPTGRPGGLRDIGMLRVDSDGGVGPVTWLTSSEGVAEDGPHLASYGRNFLAGWTVETSTILAEVDASGAVLEGPAETKLWIQPKDDFTTVQGGDVLLSVASAPRTELMIQRIQYCQR